MQNKKEHKYINMLAQLNGVTIENKQITYSKLYEQFLKKLQKQTKLKFTFDDEVTTQMISYVNEVRNKYKVGNQFDKSLEFVKKFSHQLLSQKFISKKKYKILSQRLLLFEDDLGFKIHAGLQYLRNAEDKDEFRRDFFSELIGDDEIDVTDQETVKSQYQKFLTKCLSNQIDDKQLTYLEGCMSKFQNLDQMMPSDLMAKIRQKLGGRVGTKQFQVELNKEFKALAESQSFSLKGSGQKEIQLNQQFANIISILNKFSGLKLFKQKQPHMKFHVDKFGSLVSGFAGSDADLDITILTNCYVDEMAFLEYLHDFLTIQAKQLQKKGSQKHYKINLINTARVPLIQLTIMKRQKRDMRGGSRNQDKILKIDILLNNMLGVINSRFLQIYSQVSWIRYLGILIKKWAKAKKIIGKKMLSSYSIILMMLHFLIETNKVKLILDARGRNDQYAHFMYKRVKENVIQQFPVYYKFKCQKKDVTSIERANLVSIMKEFFYFYSEKGDHWKKNQAEQIITVDGTKNKQFEEKVVFTIKDPFDEPHNPGRAADTQKSYFLNKFQQAYDNLCSNNKNQAKNLFCSTFI